MKHTDWDHDGAQGSIAPDSWKARAEKAEEEREALRRMLDKVRAAFDNGAHDDLMAPGETLGAAVARLVAQRDALLAERGVAAAAASPDNPPPAFLPEWVDPIRQRESRVSPFMEQLVTSGHRFPILDDGFIQVVDYMGTDKAVVNAARLTAGTLAPGQSDRGLLRYLLRMRHTTPVEFCELVLHIRAPMDVWRQWVRHRTAVLNEYSTRYSPAIDARAQTDPSQWRAQSGANRQGSDGLLASEWPPHFSFDGDDDPRRAMSPGAWLTAQEAGLHEHAMAVYHERLELGVAREQARKDLLLSTYTEAFWKIDLHNLLHFLGLRMDSHAQKEIRAYAAVIGTEIVAKWCPLVWEAFEDFRLGGQSLTRLDMAALIGPEEGIEDALRTMTKRERGELLEKISLFVPVAQDRVLKIREVVAETGLY